MSASMLRGVRALLGLYLIIHFAQLVPFAAELFSNEGLLPVHVHPLLKGLPSSLSFLNSHAAAVGSVRLGLCFGGLLLVTALWLSDERWQWVERVASAGALVAWIWLHLRMPFIRNPSLPYIGWMLLVLSVAPRVRSSDIGGSRLRGGLPRAWWTLSLALLMVGYSFSGITKASSFSWIDGSALWHVVRGPLARPHALSAWMVEHPELLRWSTWAVLGLEIAAAPLCCVRRLRPWVWTAFVGLHLGILCLVNFADLTVGMLLMHAFTFDPRWLRGRTSHDGHYRMRSRGSLSELKTRQDRQQRLLATTYLLSHPGDGGRSRLL